MLHLSTERLATLVDESPTPAELAHLTSCAECSRERAMYRSLADLAASESTRIGAPLTRWESLAPALLADGVIDDGRVLRLGSRHARRPWLQAAAAVLFIAGGMMAGRYTAGASVLPIGGSSATVASMMDTNPRFQSAARSASGSRAVAGAVRNRDGVSRAAGHDEPLGGQPHGHPHASGGNRADAGCDGRGAQEVAV